ncbi:MAG: hypothetical protein WCV41_04660, partial [Patescibacteria group bacterium]
TGQQLTAEEIAGLRENKADGNVDVLRTQDTDKDGLSDYDELYFYNTSPYLEDTDSDGIADKTEIEKGQDPNCPLGQECFSSETQTSPDENSSVQSSAASSAAQSSKGIDMEAFNSYMEQSASADASASSGTANSADLNVSDADLEKQVIEDILAGKADATSLRELLKRSGMDPKMLEKISDEQLTNTYKQTLSSNK